MTYEQVKSLKPEDFKRLCGVRPETFKQMLVSCAIAQLTKTKNRTTREALLGRPIVDDIGILERIPNLLSYWAMLGNKRVYGIPNYPKNRRYAG